MPDNYELEPKPGPRGRLRVIAASDVDPGLSAVAALVDAQTQTEGASRLSRALGNAARIVEPVYPPRKLYDVYNSDPDVEAAVNALIEAVVGGGPTIKRADNTDALGSSSADDIEPKKQLDPVQRKTLAEFLRAPNEDPSVTFTTLNRALLRDVVVTGPAYPRFDRRAGKIFRASYLSSVHMRRGEDLRLFYRVNGTTYEPFRALGASSVAVTQKITVSAEGAHFEVPVVLKLADKDSTVEDYAAGVEGLAEAPAISFSKPLEGGGTETVAADVRVAAKLDIGELPEVGFMYFDPDPANDYYPRPKLLSALLDHVVNRSIARYNRAFFDNNTMPPLAIVVTGGELGDEGIRTIDETLRRKHGGVAQQHRTFLLELTDPDTKVVFNKLESDRQHEGHFIELRDKGARRVFAVLRVPYSYVNQDAASSEGVLKEAVRIFMAGIVKFLREWLAAYWNRVFRDHMGVEDWIIEWQPIEAEDLATRLNAWKELLLRGVLTINEVRDELGVTPMPGGDDNFITIQGTGVVLIDLLRQLGEEALKRVKAGDQGSPFATGGVQTPARGAGPVLASGGM